MEEEKKLVFDQYLGVLIEQFDLSHETIKSLKEKLTWKFIQAKVVLFMKKNQVIYDSFKERYDMARHKKTINILKKYANEEALLKYMEDEGWKYKDKDMEGYVDGVKFNCFVVYPKKDDELVKKSSNDLWKFAKSLDRSWEFKDVDNELVIGWL